MGLRFKTIIVMTTMLAILAAGIFIITQKVLVDGFSKVEAEQAEKNYSRLHDALSDQVDQMTGRTMDYAKWTDMYNYIDKPTKDFEENNIILDSLNNLKIDFMAVLRKDGTLLSYVSNSKSTNQKSPFTTELLSKIRKLNKKIIDANDKKPMSGFLVIGNQVVCISTQPALHSDGKGQVHGFVLMGSIYGLDRVKSISNMIHLQATVGELKSSSEMMAHDAGIIENGGTTVTIPLDRNVMRTYCVVDDLEDNKSIFLAVDSARTVYRQMLETREWLVLWLIGSGIVIFISSVWLVDRVVTCRLVSLSARTKEIALSADTSSRIGVKGTDEIGALANTVNAMLDSIELKTHQILDAQKAIERSERRNSQVIESTNAGIYEFNRTTNRIRVNDALRRILEWDDNVDEVGLDKVRECIHPDDRSDLREVMFENLNIQTTFALDMRVKSIVGGYRWIHMTGKKLVDVDAHDIVVGSVVDITTKKRAELELLKIYQLTELSDDFIAMADLDGYVNYVNPSGIEMTALDPRAEASLPAILSYYPEFEHERLKNEILPEVRRDGKWIGEIYFLGADRKSTILMLEAIIQISDPKTNEPTCLGTVARDITAQRQAEQELAKTRDAALDLARVKASFLANMSHEIRTPMNGIIGMVGLLADTKLNAEQKDYTRIIQNSAESLLAIINDILDFSKIEAGKLTIEDIKFNLRDLIEESVRLLADSAHRKGIEVICRIPPELPDCCISDPTRIRQVMMNLVGNAIKFTEKGRVVVMAEQTNDDQSRPTIKIKVVDTGIGISADKHATIFDSFTQADSSSSRRFGGTGLGLTISKQIVGLLGGEIGIESEVGHGSTFWFEIPVRKAASNKRKSPVRKLNATYTVLAVDDDETNRLVYRENLKAWQINCVECKNGREAVELLATEQDLSIDVILMDLQMPDLDGIQTTAAIRDLPGCIDIPIILATSSGKGYNKDELADMGINAFLHKPILQSQLFDLLASILNGEDAIESEKSEVPATDLAGMSILLVEDNPVNRKVGVKSLQKMGAKVTVAENGQEGVEKWRTERFDCVLMDCQMPILDGFEATKEIRRLENGRESRTKIVAMTAGTSDEDRQRSQICGMDAFLTKPIRPSEVLEVLSNCRRSGLDEPREEAVVKTVFNAQRLIDICDGDQDFLAEIIGEFERSSDTIMTELETHIGVGDLEAVRGSAHKLKGSSRNIGGDKLAAVCEELELCAKNGVNAGLDEILERIRSALSDLKSKLLVVGSIRLNDAA